MALTKEFDVCYAFKSLPWAFFPGWLACRLRGKKIVLDWDEDEGELTKYVMGNSLVAKCLSAFEKYAVRHADHVVVVSPFLKKRALKLGRENKDITQVHNGIDPSLFGLSGKKASAKVLLKESSILFIGALRPQFDIDIIIKAMIHVGKKFPKTVLFIVGSGPAKEQLKVLTMQLGLEKKVKFLGKKPHKDIPSFIGAASLVLAPNRNNNINKSRSSVKIAEYMALSKPIVANDVGLASDMLKGVAFLVKSDNPKDFAKGIITLLSDKKRAAALGIAARKRALEKFTWKTLAAPLQQCFGSFKD